MDKGRGWELHTIIDNLEAPICVQFLNNDKDMYIGEQRGIILKKNGSKLSTFLDISNKVTKLNNKYDEKGLLSFCFDPKYKENLVYVFYTQNNNNISTQKKHPFIVIISRIDMSINEEEILLSIPWTDFEHHFGGRLVFGNDNYLYISVGDAGPQKDPENHAQNLSLKYGKILRIDTNTTFRTGYKIPNSNPILGDKKTEIYAYGLRNPWSISFDNRGRLFVADVGFETIEEIDIVEKGDNLGWNTYEGDMKTEFGKVKLDTNTLKFPIFTYTHDQLREIRKRDKDKGVAIIGGYITKEGCYIFADYSGIIMCIKEQKNDLWILDEYLDIDEIIRSFGKDERGNIYICCSITPGVNKKEGKIYRLEF